MSGQILFKYKKYLDVVKDFFLVEKILKFHGSDLM
jgi:hypothetical protein